MIYVKKNVVSMQNALIVSCHMDDEALSCGAYIQDRISKGYNVQVVSMFGRKYNYGKGEQYVVEQEFAFMNSCMTLGATPFRMCLSEGEPTENKHYPTLRYLEGLMKEFTPSEIVIPDSQDRNQDHNWLHDLCKITLRPWNIPYVKKVLMWQSPDGLPKDSNYYVPMTEQMERTKLSAVEWYTRESRVSPHPRSIENLKAWHKLVGSQCAEFRAEPFRLLYSKD